MPKIKFTAQPKLPRDMEHLGYKKGDVVTLPDDQCERWIRRGVAAYVSDVAPAPEPAAAADVKAPEPTAPESTPAPEPAAAARSETPARQRRFGRQSE